MVLQPVLESFFTLAQMGWDDTVILLSACFTYTYLSCIHVYAGNLSMFHYLSLLLTLLLFVIWFV